MKNTITSSLTAILLSMGALGCSKEEPLPYNSDNTRTPISVTVTDDGYIDNDPRTRAVEKGYATEFTTGDRIGLYVVKDGKIISDNIPLTNNGTEWVGNAYSNGPGAKYFAYYPYKNNVNVDLVPNANTAAEFFANVVSEWTPDTSQKTYENYTAQDLMIGNGTLGDKQNGKYTLHFTMEHTMALIVIEPPTKKYTFSGGKIPDYWAPVYNAKFYNFTPYFIDGRYRLLVKPNQTGAADLKGSYNTLSEDTRYYDISQNGIAAAKYMLTKVDGGITENLHELRVGDYFLKDGSLINRLSQISNDQKAACIGIVYWVGDATAKDATLKKNHPNCVHGLVVSIKDVPSSWQATPVSVQEWLDANHSGKFLPVQSGTEATDPLNNIQGYNNTKAIEAFNLANNDANNTPVNAVQKVLEYRKAVPAPSISSNWYLPSVKELSIICGKDVSDNIWGNESIGTSNLSTINTTISYLGSNGKPLSAAAHWSSSESDDLIAYVVDFTNGKVALNSKNYSSHTLRFALAF